MFLCTETYNKLNVFSETLMLIYTFSDTHKYILIPIHWKTQTYYPGKNYGINKNNLTTEKTQNIFYLIADLSDFRECSPNKLGGCPRGVMVKAMDCGIVVREFALQSRYYVHFRANTLGKGTNPLILPAMGQIVPQLFF